MRLTIQQRANMGLALGAALVLVIGLGCRPAQTKTVEENLFLNESNRFVGRGADLLINLVLSGDDPATPGFDPDGEIGDPDGPDGPIPPHLIQRIDVGDVFTGIGNTDTVECLSCPPGSETIHTLGSVGNNAKVAVRAFKAIGKERVPDGFNITFGPVTPVEFSEIIATASNGAVVIAAESIPVGTMVLVFDDPTPNYTQMTVSGSPGTNWVEATDGTRLWNVGIESPENFWMATFLSDDLGMLPLMPPTFKTGTIKFGLSRLPGGEGRITFEPVPYAGPEGKMMNVDFCFKGTAVGTFDVETPFPIHLETEVRFHPVQ